MLTDLDVVPVPILEAGEGKNHVGAGRFELGGQGEMNSFPWGQNLI